MPKLQVIQTPENEVPAEVLATSIQTIANSMKALNSTRLRRETIVALIHLHSKLPRKTIEIVLNNLDSLEQTWLKPKRTAT